ncbi:TetR family transcriptional regulator C-terminal domain-containing protein [Faecalicatena contorta]|uniref:TetR-like C-terminal domain-containing protein n=1 Tax=Faecalicatena contorta TaxID=39482 RepID=UPI001F21145A|nr:TetR-like C-terminal domain-containing protein [Faecalicatena contorta]MCF2681209.1 TetR family transcriptional regulator C-terminal domain-containing protein [Faecalicatena contorta]
MLRFVKKIDLLADSEEAIRFVADYVDNNRHIINCTYDCMGHEDIKRFFYSDFIGVMQGVIEEGVQQLHIKVSDEFKIRLTVFYTEALVGSMLNWIKNRENTDKESLIQDTLFICHNSIPQLLKKRAETEAARRPL